MYSEDDLLPLSGIQHLLFCERRMALLQIESQWADNIFTVEGSILHSRADASLPLEVRGDVRIARGLMLRSLALGLSGKADVVEFHQAENEEKSEEDGLASAIPLAGAAGLWRPFPVEYKRGRLRIEKGYEAQLCAQAICLEEMLGVHVPRGAIFFGKNRRRKLVNFDSGLRELTADAARRMHEIVREGNTPAARYEKKCQSCSLLDLCLPRLTSKKGTVAGYLAKALADL